jgi:hypothetical protein
MAEDLQSVLNLFDWLEGFVMNVLHDNRVKLHPRTNPNTGIPAIDARIPPVATILQICC